MHVWRTKKMDDNMKSEEKHVGKNTTSQQLESTDTKNEIKEAEASTISSQETKTDVSPSSNPQTVQEEKTVPLDKYLRLMADFENYKKRVLREQNEFLINALKKFVLELLPVIDDFDKAIEYSGNIQSLDTFVDGIRMIHSRLIQTLTKFGVTTWDSKGEKFDPEKHHALSRVISDTTPENTIVDEVKRGYMLNGRIIRPAEVIVAFAPETPCDENAKSLETPQSDTKNSQTTSTE